MRAKELERIPRYLDGLGTPRFGPLHPVAPCAEASPRTRPHEAVASPLLAALYRLEQKARLSVIEPAEQRQRRVEVRQDLAHDGDPVTPFREVGELFRGGAEQRCILSAHGGPESGGMT
jgi:hypothetical protein